MTNVLKICMVKITCPYKNPTERQQIEMSVWNKLKSIGQPTFKAWIVRYYSNNVGDK